MYKVFSGEKCIEIMEEKENVSDRNAKVLAFSSAELLHKEYKHFVHISKSSHLIITGDVERIWKVFCSLFFYIEASGGVVKNEKGELLMIFRNKHWDLPKGRIEKGESPEIASVREVQEECGISQLKLGKHLIDTYHIFFQNNKEQIKRTYWFEMTCSDTSAPSAQKEEGIEQVKWMSKGEISELRKKVYPSLQDVLAISSF